MALPPLILGLGPSELLLVLAVVLLLFGAAAIPKLARSLGKAQGEFSKARQEFDKELKAGQREAGSPGATEGASEERIRQTARDLGIEESGMSLDEVKKALNEKLG